MTGFSGIQKDFGINALEKDNSTIINNSVFLDDQIFGKDRLKSEINHSIQKQSLEKTKKAIGETEYDNFINFFNLKNDKEIYEKIKEISPEDSIVGPKSLRKLYIEHYSKNPEKMSESMKERWNTYNIFKNHKGVDERGVTININNIPDVFNKNMYYGENVGENIVGTYFNENLYKSVISDRIDTHIKGGKNKIIMEKFEGKYVLRMYKNGELNVLTYMSPGTNDNKSPENRNIKFDGVKGKYHASSTHEGAPMFLAVHVDGSIWIHTSKLVDGKPHSKGCFRVPILYEKEIFTSLRKGTKIEIKDLYK